jgi:pseudoazurin
MTKLTTALFTGLLLSVMSFSTAFAADKTVMAQAVKFEPMVVKISPGDSVIWRNMPTHNVQMMLVPEGADKFTTKLGDNFSHKFEKEGIYVYQCDPHIGYGMGGVVIVGNPVNLDALKSADVSGGLGRVLDEAIKSAEKM